MQDAATNETPLPVSIGKMSVPVDLVYLRTVQACTAEITKILSYGESDVVMLELAVEEGFTNAVKHFSKTAEKEESIHVEFDLLGEDLVILIRDRGIPFEIDEVESYEASDASDADRPGLGLTLMKKSVDKVELISCGSKGKELRLTKHLPAGYTLPEFLCKDGRSRTSRRSVDINSVIIRQPTLDDLPSIRRLTWRSYGYRYVSQFYDMEKLRELYDSPFYLPAVAVDPESGEVIFHIALELETSADTVPEEGMAFIDPMIRCVGLAKKVSEFLHEIAAQRGFRGIRAEAVTSHIQSQKILEDGNGTVPCGLLVAYGKNDLIPSDLPVSVQNRATGITHYYVTDRTPATVYLPERHAGMIGEIYGWMNLPRTFGAPYPCELPELSDVQCVPGVEMNNFKINVLSVGKDCLDVIRSNMDEARRNCFEAIFLRFPLDIPSAPGMVEACEKMGLSFAGIVPFYLGGRDAIVLQWVGVQQDMSAIKIYGDRGRKLFDYVKTCLGY